MPVRIKEGYDIHLVFLSLLFLITLSSVQVSSKGKRGVLLDYECIDSGVVPAEERAVPVIMLHGMTEAKETWNGIYENISKLTKRKVCVYDARNHGDSSWNDPLSIDALAGDLEYFMNVMNMQQAILVGHSMGGHTAMKLALMNSSRVCGVIAEDIGMELIPNGESMVRFYIRRMLKSLSKIPEGADEATARKVVGDYMKMILGSEAPSETYHKKLPLRLRNGVWEWKTNFRSLEKALDNMDEYYAKLEGVYKGKALFIYGKSSPFRIWEQEEEIKTIFPNAVFTGIEGAGHFTHFAEREYTKHLLNFLT